MTILLTAAVAFGTAQADVSDTPNTPEALDVEVKLVYGKKYYKTPIK